jgi:hypothetical protein
MKSELVECLGLAETLQDGAAIRDAEAKATILEAENSNLKIELKALQTEVEAFRAERKQREEKERDIDPTQFKILKRLPSQYVGRGLTVEEISRLLHIRLDDLEVYMNGLDKMGFIAEERHEIEGLTWRRSTTGNEFVVAKRWAGEDEPEETKRKHADLSKPEEIALAIIAGGGSEGAEESEIAKQLAVSPLATTLVLVTLREKSMVAEVEEATYTATPMWRLQRDGMEYLAERGKL